MNTIDSVSTHVDPSPLSTRSCSPQHHIFFLKTHKTGSSTMANIFFRYGDFRNLAFVLPRYILFEWPQRFQASLAAPLQTRRPNILCSHTRFNKKPINWIFPKDSSKYITILRNPVDNFESAFRYMKLGEMFGFGNHPNSLQKFLENGVSFANMLKRHNPLVNLIRNPLMFDLGLSFKYYQNFTAINEYIQFLDKEFDLVMIADYFDESLVLMKRLLCWEMHDILYVKLNVRVDNETGTILTEDVRENIKRWNKADVLLFEHFNKSFWEKVKNEGESFNEELAAFRQKNTAMKQACIENKPHFQTIYEGKLAKGHSIREKLPRKLRMFCEKLIKSEEYYLKNLREKPQHQRTPSSSIDLPQNYNEHEEEDKKSWDTTKELSYFPVLTLNHDTRETSPWRRVGNLWIKRGHRAERMRKRRYKARGRTKRSFS